MNMKIAIYFLSINPCRFLYYRGIPYVSKDRQLRVEAIGEYLAEGNFDVVSLQEVWSEHDYQYLKKRTENVLPYAHYFYRFVFKFSKLFDHRIIWWRDVKITPISKCWTMIEILILLINFSGVLGSGLCILSKHPIVKTLFHAWSVNGYVHRIQHGN